MAKKNYDSRVDRKRGGRPRSVPSPANNTMNNIMEQQTGRMDKNPDVHAHGGGGRPRTRGQQRHG